MDYSCTRHPSLHAPQLHTHPSLHALQLHTPSLFAWTEIAHAIPFCMHRNCTPHPSLRCNYTRLRTTARLQQDSQIYRYTLYSKCNYLFFSPIYFFTLFLCSIDKIHVGVTLSINNARVSRLTELQQLKAVLEILLHGATWSVLVYALYLGTGNEGAIPCICRQVLFGTKNHDVTPV